MNSADVANEMVEELVDEIADEIADDIVDEIADDIVDELVDEMLDQSQDPFDEQLTDDDIESFSDLPVDYERQAAQEQNRGFDLFDLYRINTPNNDGDWTDEDSEDDDMSELIGMKEKKFKNIIY